MIEAVVTGGQTGSDQAAWRAAKAAGIRCLGWMPRGYMTEAGPRPEFADLYGAQEYHSDAYPARTRMNLGYVADEAGCAVCFDASDRMSPGTKCLVNAHADLIRRGMKVGLVVIKLARVDGRLRVANPEYRPPWVVRAIVNAGGGRLMIAGNRELSAPGIGVYVDRYMTAVFELLRDQSPDLARVLAAQPPLNP